VCGHVCKILKTGFPAAGNKISSQEIGKYAIIFDAVVPRQHHRKSIIFVVYHKPSQNKNIGMKVLLINGSPRKEGNTYVALSEVAGALQNNGVETEIIGIGTKPVQGCIACNKCSESGRCVFKDELYGAVRDRLPDADALVVGTPVYYAGANGSLCALLDRIFYSSSALLQYKPAAAIAVCRRGGASSAFDRLNKYFTITNMPVVSSQYWNILHGRLPGEVRLDAEGLQIMRTLGKNMAWLLKSIKAGGRPIPEKEEPQITDFIR
jgi:multimeric flavodoxin WrbA